MKFRHALMFAAAAVAGAAVLLSPVKVGTRVTSIDLSGVYPGLQDYSEGRRGCIVSAGDYPSGARGDYFHYAVPDGHITVHCMLDDFDGWIRNLRSYHSVPTSQPIGEQSFFEDSRHSADEDWELAYRRHNVSVCFRFSLTNTARPNFIRSGEYKAELEKSAKLLDEAIGQRKPYMQVEDVWAYQVVAYEVKSFVGGLILIVLRWFHPDWHM